MKPSLPFAASVLLTSIAAAAAGGCSSGKQVKLQMEREVVLSQPEIRGVSLTPSGRIDTGAGPAAVSVRMEGDENLKATFEIPGLVEERAMREDSPGVYVGSFDVRQGLSGQVPVNVQLKHEPTGAMRRVSVAGGLELFVGKPAASGGTEASGAGAGIEAGAGSGSACSAATVRELDAALEGLTVHFDFNQSEMPAAEKSRLSAAAELLRSHPECAIVVHGHADEVGYEGYNLALSMRRAMEVAAFLETLGVPSERIMRRWHGESEPLEQGTDDSSRAKNRRAELRSAPMR